MSFMIGITDGDWIIDIRNLPYHKRDRLFAIHYKEIAHICVGSYRKWEIPDSLIISNEKTQNQIQFTLKDDIKPGENSSDDLDQLTYVGSHKGVSYSIIIDLRVR